MNYRIKEALMYITLSVIFFAVATPLIFPLVMCIMKVMFMIIGALCLIPSYLILNDYFKKPKS